MNFLSFPDIAGLHNVIKAIDAYPHLAGSGMVSYRGKIKLHGTNAGVQISSSGEIAAQSRTQIITPDNDNAGFARWVETRKEFFKNVGRNGVNLLTQMTPPTYTVFGEWCGPGIMKGTAINNIPTKVFAVFAVMMGDVVASDNPLSDTTLMVTDPEEIKELLGTLPSDVHVLPWETPVLTLNFSNRADLEQKADFINTLISLVEKEDPWVKATFGVEGISEGIVYYPGAGNRITRKQYSDLTFKAKGEKHKVNQNKERKAVIVDPTVAASVAEFVPLFATEARFEQGLSVVGSTEMKNIGPFLKWIGQDVLKESKAELEASNLEWSQVEKSIQTVARSWFIVKNKTIAV